MVEYMVSFLIVNYDLVKEIIEVLDKLEKWFELYKLMFEKFIMIVGFVGVGKIYIICDAVLMWLNSGFKSIVLFGEYFIDGELWE